MKILCSGDIHLGRQPTRLGPQADGRAVSPAAVWAAMVDWAIEHGVELLLLSGDVVDRENRFYEAVGPLERGLVRLGEAGIRVAAVTGNHDFDVLPRVVRAVGEDRLTLLGREGEWQRATFELSEGKVHVDGWSFPTQHVRESPLTSYRSQQGTDGLKLMLVHGDLDQPASDYAPLDSAELRRLPIDACVLGHIHKPMVDAERGRALLAYPGSLQPLDPGEPHQHGALLLNVEAGAVASAEMVPLATVRYKPIDVDVTDAATLDEVDHRLVEALREAARQAAEEAADGGAGELAHLRCRVTLHGRTRLHRLLTAHVEQAVDALDSSHEGTVATVEKIRIRTAPAVDLAQLARGSDAPAMLARTLLTLEDSGDDSLDDEAGVARLIAAAQRGAGQVRKVSAYRDLEDSHVAVEPAEARRLLREQGLLLLDELLSQKEATGGDGPASFAGGTRP